MRPLLQLLAACAACLTLAAVEIDPKVDGPFRALFKDANLLDIKRKESTDWFAMSLSIGGGKIVTYELTLSDTLNKKFKATYSRSGELLHTDTYRTPIANLPAEVQVAVAKLFPSANLETVVEAKCKYLKEGRGFQLSGKIDGVKLDVEIPTTKLGSEVPKR